MTTLLMKAENRAYSHHAKILGDPYPLPLSIQPLDIIFLKRTILAD